MAAKAGGINRDGAGLTALNAGRGR